MNGRKPRKTKTNLHPTTNGSRCKDWHPITGLNSWSSIEEREQGSCEQRGQDHNGENHRDS